MIAVGAKTLRKALEEVSRQNIHFLNLENLPARAEAFVVGSTMDVEPRLGPGFNQRGGVATVMSRKSTGGETLYSVRYPIGGGGERDLPVALLSLHTETTGPRLSSSSSSAAASSTISSAATFSGARCAMDMRQEFDDKMKEKQMKVER